MDHLFGKIHLKCLRLSLQNANVQNTLTRTKKIIGRQIEIDCIQISCLGSRSR